MIFPSFVLRDAYTTHELEANTSISFSVARSYLLGKRFDFFIRVVSFLSSKSRSYVYMVERK